MNFAKSYTHEIVNINSNLLDNEAVLYGEDFLTEPRYFDGEPKLKISKANKCIFGEYHPEMVISGEDKVCKITIPKTPIAHEDIEISIENNGCQHILWGKGKNINNTLVFENVEYKDFDSYTTEAIFNEIRKHYPEAIIEFLAA